MISLDHDRTGISFLTVDGAPGDAWYFLVTDNGFSVNGQCDQSAYQFNVIGLPLACVAGHHVRRWKKTVDGAEQVSAGILSFAVYDLNFIAAPKIDAAVASFRIAEFNMQFEVGEFLVCGDIGSGGRAYHDTVFHFPLVIAHGMPS